MDVYIVGTIRNNKNMISGYILVDLDDNNRVMNVSREQLIRVLSLKKLKLSNAKLAQGRIQGTYYPLSSLSYIAIENKTIENNGILVLKQTKLGKYICSVVNNTGVIIRELEDRQLEGKGVINRDGNGNILARVEQLKSIKSPLDDLDKQALDKDVVWSLRDFDLYMTRHGWSYDRIPIFMPGIDGSAYAISNISPECDVIHLPKEVYRVQNLFSKLPNKKIKVIILNSNLESIETLYDKERNEGINLLEVDEFHIQTSNRIRPFNLNGIHHMIINNKIEMPSNIKVITYIFNNCNLIGGISFKNLRKNSNISFSFGYSIFKDADIDLNVESVDSSFNYAKGIRSIRTGEALKSIDNSFNRCNITSLDFRMSEDLEGLTASFGYNTVIKELDLSSNLKLCRIDGFTECSNLSHIELPNGSVDLHVGYPLGRYLPPDGEYGAFRNCPIDELVLHSNLDSLSHPVGQVGYTKIIFMDDVGVVKGSYYLDFDNTVKQPIIKYRCQKLKIDISELWGYAKYYESLEDIGILNNQVEELLNRSFARIKIKQFDSKDYPVLKVIGEKAFLNSSLKVLILDNLDTIEGSILADCKDINTIAIGDNIGRISKAVVNNLSTRYTIKAYVIKGSPIYKILKTKTAGKFLIIEVGSMDEARKLINGEITSDSITINRFRALLGNNMKYDAIFKEPYINNIKFIYKLYSALIKDIPLSVPYGIDLDESKYIRVSFSQYSEFKRLLDKEKSEILDSGIGLDTNILRFNGISNLITLILDVESRLINYQVLENLFGSEKNKISLKHVLYVDNDDNAIVTFEVDANFLCRIGIIVIIKSGEVRFISTYNVDAMLNNEGARGDISISYKRSIISNNYKEYSYYKRIKSNISFGNILRTGDLIPGSQTEDAIISGAYVPSSNQLGMDDRIIDFFKSNTRIVYTGPKVKAGRVEVLYYDIIEQRFILALLSSCSSSIDDYASILVKEVYDRGSVGNIDKKYLKLLAEFTIKKYDSENCLAYWSLTSDKKKAIESDINNYDINNNKLYSIVQSEYNIGSGYKSIGDITVERLINFFIKSGLYGIKEIAYNTLEKTAKYSVLNSWQHDTWELIEYSDDKHNYMYFINLKGKADGNRKKKCFISKVRLIDTFNILKGYDSKYRPLNRISDDDISDIWDQFYKIKYYRFIFGRYKGDRILLVIDKGNLDPYIVYEQENKKTLLFRFKDIGGAEQSFLDMQNSTQKEYLDTLLDYLNLCDNQVTNVMKLKFISARNMIISGFPNKLPYRLGTWSGTMELVDKLAKQPSE